MHGLYMTLSFQVDEKYLSKTDNFGQLLYRLKSTTEAKIEIVKSKKLES